MKDHNQSEKFVIEWDLYDEGEDTIICGGGRFTSVYETDYQSARKAAFEEQVKNLFDRQGVIVLIMDWKALHVTYQNDKGIYSLINFR